MGVKFLEDEIGWIKDTGNMERESYLRAHRKGRGSQIGQLKRNQIFDLFIDFQKYLERGKKLDWAELPHLEIEGIDGGSIIPDRYDAILIDEAQDFAPVWIKLVNHLMNPASGFLFLADDPAQSIYRFHSWREKGIEVVGRTRWLRIPYRNTYEIYQAAYQLIASDEKLLRSLKEEGIMVEPDLSSAVMRHGAKPLIQRYASEADEMRNTRECINQLLQDGVKPGQIAVLHRYKKSLERFEVSLRGTDVINETFHRLKGLEFEAVFLCQLQNTHLRNGGEELQSAERRLAYMAMTRARTQLYMGYVGKLPQIYNGIMNYVDHII
jgi:superfamily I DNA/RNA helicase